MNYRMLEKLGRVRLSKNFFFREFLHSEVGNFYGIQNIPTNPELAIQNGKRLCKNYLEPLQENYGRLFIRSGYRSSQLNQFCANKKLGCASNNQNYGYHIWDIKDEYNNSGAMACIVISSYVDEYERTKDYQPIENWIKWNLPPSELQFFKNLCAFNIGWNDKLL